MAFRFSLAAVLRARVLQEEREERALQQILREIADARLDLQQVDSEIARRNAERERWKLKPFAGRELHLVFGEVEELRRCAQEFAVQIDKLEVLRGKQTAAYQAARQARQLLTEMREQQRLVHDSALAMREQKTLDDIFGARLSRG